MERKNPFPEFHILFNPQKLREFGGRLLRLLTPPPHDAPDYMSNHYRGAEEMLNSIESTPLPDTGKQEE